MAHIEITTHWPAYELPGRFHPEDRLAHSLPGRAVTNGDDRRAYLAGDEHIRIGSIPPVQASYHQACLTLLTST